MKLTEKEQQMLNTALPCPFCWSSDLTTTLWCEDKGEYMAISCKQCKAEAPGTSWNNRANGPQSPIIQQLNNGEIPNHLKNL